MDWFRGVPLTREYKIIHPSINVGSPEAMVDNERELNELAQDGWEVIAVAPIGAGTAIHRVYLRREREREIKLKLVLDHGVDVNWLPQEVHLNPSESRAILVLLRALLDDSEESTPYSP